MNDVFSMIFSGINSNDLQGFLLLIPIFLIVFILPTPWFKGLLGEFLVNFILSKLPDTEYTLIKNVTLPTEDGTTQIDHVVVSKYGIFVIETKNLKGWIYGGPRQKLWTQKIYKYSVKFQNPLHQNYKHIKTIESLLGINKGFIHSVIVFIGDSTFKSKMPDNVTYASGCTRYIKTFNEPVFTSLECLNIVNAIESGRLQRGLVTNIRHSNHVKSIVKSKAN